VITKEAEFLKDERSVITLTLLHPIQSIPVQSWAFKNESAIKIGRSNNNEVVLYSAVVSRHHVEIRRDNHQWQIINLGANGTYIDGERINKTLATDGMIIRLASSGPKILININSDRSEGVDDTEIENVLSAKRANQQKDMKKTLISGEQ
jgi:pSer/pThr/pTyr-binding forkhead associated (FHA) protein